MLAQASDQQRVVPVHQLQRHPARLAREAHEAEAAGGHHDDLRRLSGVVRVRGVSAEAHYAVLGVAPRQPPHRFRAARGASRDLGNRGAEECQRLAGMAVHRYGACLHGVADEVLECAAIAVQEGRAL